MMVLAERLVSSDDKLYTSLSANTIMAKVTNHFQRTKLTNIIHLTLKMTSANVVETSVTNNSSLQNYTHPDDHTIRTTDTPGFKPFAIENNVVTDLNLAPRHGLVLGRLSV